jgi:hypothetical protein
LRPDTNLRSAIQQPIGVTDRITQILIDWYGGGMAYEQRDMSGTLFKNDKREKDTHPNATGTCMVAGVEYYVSAWTKDGKKGKFQSLSFKRKDAQAAKPAAREPGQDDDDAPPF